MSPNESSGDDIKVESDIAYTMQTFAVASQLVAEQPLIPARQSSVRPSLDPSKQGDALISDACLSCLSKMVASPGHTCHSCVNSICCYKCHKQHQSCRRLCSIKDLEFQEAGEQLARLSLWVSMNNNTKPPEYDDAAQRFVNRFMQLKAQESSIIASSAMTRPLLNQEKSSPTLAPAFQPPKNREVNTVDASGLTHQPKKRSVSAGATHAQSQQDPNEVQQQILKKLEDISSELSTLRRACEVLLDCDLVPERPATPEPKPSAVLQTKQAKMTAYLTPKPEEEATTTPNQTTVPGKFAPRPEPVLRAAAQTAPPMSKKPVKRDAPWSPSIREPQAKNARFSRPIHQTLPQRITANTPSDTDQIIELDK